MNILAIETALGSGQVALWTKDRIVGAATIEDPRSLAEHLVSTVDLVLERAGFDYPSLDRIAVTVGPGTFTGLRIGLAAARAIGLAAERPIVGVTTLEALAEGVAHKADDNEAVIAAIDARRGQIYFQAFHMKPTGLISATAGKAVDVSDIDKVVPEGPVLAVGSGAALVAAIRNNDVRLMEDFDRIDMGAFCALARNITPTGAAPAPLYLREPDAKLPKVS